MDGHRVYAREALQEVMSADNLERVTSESFLAETLKGSGCRSITPQDSENDNPENGN
jgi:hypothetical protein